MEIACDVEEAMKEARSGGGPPNQSSNGGFCFQSSGGVVSRSNTAGGTNNGQNATGSGRLGQSNGRLGASVTKQRRRCKKPTGTKNRTACNRNTSSQPPHQNRSHCVEIKLAVVRPCGCLRVYGDSRFFRSGSHDFDSIFETHMLSSIAMVAAGSPREKEKDEEAVWSKLAVKRADRDERERYGNDYMLFAVHDKICEPCLSEGSKLLVQETEAEGGHAEAVVPRVL